MKSERSEREQADRWAGELANGQLNGSQQPAAQDLLDAVCRNVTELAKTAPLPPRRIRLQSGQTTVEVEWPEPGAPALRSTVVATATAAGPAALARPTGLAEDADTGLHYVRSPMVGTFYHADAPDSPPFVKVGDLVTAGQPVGILEAMKMMNTIKADADGRVVELLAPNGQPVEFDQWLIALEPVAENS